MGRQEYWNEFVDRQRKKFVSEHIELAFNCRDESFGKGLDRIHETITSIDKGLKICDIFTEPHEKDIGMIETQKFLKDLKFMLEWVEKGYNGIISISNSYILKVKEEIEEEEAVD